MEWLNNDVRKMDLADQIKSFFKGEAAADAKTLDEYSRDASLFEVRPQAVVFPKDSDDIKKLVNFVSLEKSKGRSVWLAPRAAGSDMTGGPLTESVVVDLSRHMNRLKEMGQGFAVVEPGMLYREFEKETLTCNWLLPSYPASREICTVGGMAANNAGGELTLRYGKTEQYIEELNMVAADGNEYVFRPLDQSELEAKMRLDTFEGELYRKMFELLDKNYDLLKKAKPNVSKNSSGYFLWNVYDRQTGRFDLTKLICGSQGTLGIITRIKFRLIRPKPASRMLLIFLKDLSFLAGIVQSVLVLEPQSFESYDDHTFRLAIRFFPEIAKRLKGNLVRLGFEFLPEFWMVISGGLPKLVLLAEFAEDTAEAAEVKARQAQEKLKKFRVKTKVTRSQREAEKYWVIRRESFSLLRHHLGGRRTAPFIDDFVVHPQDLPEFLPKLYAILGQYPDLIYTIAGHVGDANFHIIPLMNLSDPKTRVIIRELSEKVYKLVFEFRGSISGEHNDGLVRSPYLKEMYGQEVYRLFEETKRIFDPQGIFNPGKKVGASLEYALRHISTR